MATKYSHDCPICGHPIPLGAGEACSDRGACWAREAIVNLIAQGAACPIEKVRKWLSKGVVKAERQRGTCVLCKAPLDTNGRCADHGGALDVMAAGEGKLIVRSRKLDLRPNKK